MIIGDFINFIKEMDLTNMIISMIISRSLFDLVKSLIKQFLMPVVNKLLIGDDVSDIQYLGKKVDIGDILDQVVMVLVSMVIAYLIYIFITPII